MEESRPIRPERLAPCRATRRVFRFVVDGFPYAAATPRAGLADPIHHPRETIQSARQRRLGSRMARPPAPYCVLQRFREYDPRYVRPMTATSTVNNLHPRFARLPCASSAAISRFVRTRCMARFHDAPHASVTRPASTRRRFLPRVRRFLIPRTISKIAFVRSSLNRASLCRFCRLTRAVSLLSEIETADGFGQGRFHRSPVKSERIPRPESGFHRSI